MMGGKKGIWAGAGKSEWTVFIRLFAVLDFITIIRQLSQEAGMLHVCAGEDMPLPFLGPWCKDTIISLGCALEPRLSRINQHSRIQLGAKRAELSDRCAHGEKGLNLEGKTFPRHQARQQATR